MSSPQGCLSNEQKAEHCFRAFLNDFTLSEADRIRRESALLALPIHLKEAEHGKIENAILFPFGTFYHGLGFFKDDPLTAFVSTGYPEVEEKKASNVKTSDADCDSDNESSSSGCCDDTSSNDSSESEAEHLNNSRLRQTLLLDINDVLTNRDNALSGTYKDVSLTRQAKLYYRHHQHSASFPSSSTTTSAADLGCLLEAKSFMSVQASRLIKFYCLLEQQFWPFSQLVLNWARKNGVLEHAGQTDNDGLKQEHMLLLIIFFLVRRRIIPSFKLLQEWSTSQMIINEINVAFCENVEIVRKNCQMVGIGSANPKEGTLERILQLLFEFLNEMTIFNFAHYGISPSVGSSFSKFSMGQLMVRNPSNKRRLDTNSLLCIQDVLDQCQNVTRKVQENWVLRFRAHCKTSADKLFPLLWNGDLLKATLSVLNANTPLENSDSSMLQLCPDWENSLAGPVSSMGQHRRCIRFRIPTDILELLGRAHDLAQGPEFAGGLVNFRWTVETLFQKLLEEFNGIFWNKLVAAYLIQASGTRDPVHFGVIDPSGCPVELSKEEKAVWVVRSLTDLFSSSGDGSVASRDGSNIVRFYVMDDWTRESHQLFSKPVGSKSKVDTLAREMVKGVGIPRVIFGQRKLPPKRPQFMAAVELDVRFEENELYLSTFVKVNESPEFDDGPLLQRILSWYNALIKTFVIKKFFQWVGSHVIKDLEEKCAGAGQKISKKATETNLAKDGNNSINSRIFSTTAPLAPSEIRPMQYPTWNDRDGFSSYHAMNQFSQPYVTNFEHSRVVNVVSGSSEYNIQQPMTSLQKNPYRPYPNPLPIMPILNMGTGTRGRTRGGHETRIRSAAQSRNALLNKFWSKRGKRRMTPY